MKRSASAFDGDYFGRACSASLRKSQIWSMVRKTTLSVDDKPYSRMNAIRWDGLDGSGWLANGQYVPIRVHGQSEGCGVMFWAAIRGREMIVPFQMSF